MSAPTTVEVREAAALCDDPAVRAIQVPLSLEPVIAAAVRVGASIYARDHSLPIAEHRDALAAEVARLREALAIACHWWGGCGHHYDDCPVDGEGELVETECAEARRVDELAAKGAGR